MFPERARGRNDLDATRVVNRRTVNNAMAMLRCRTRAACGPGGLRRLVRTHLHGRGEHEAGSHLPRAIIGARCRSRRCT
jgi:hypothetical protein